MNLRADVKKEFETIAEQFKLAIGREIKPYEAFELALDLAKVIEPTKDAIDNVIYRLLGKAVANK